MDEQKCISVIDYESEPEAPKVSPPLVVMSLNLRTIMNTQKTTNEIVACSALIYTKGFLWVDAS